jgi:hypothetical protein
MSRVGPANGVLATRARSSRVKSARRWDPKSRQRTHQSAKSTRRMTLGDSVAIVCNVCARCAFDDIRLRRNTASHFFSMETDWLRARHSRPNSRAQRSSILFRDNFASSEACVHTPHIDCRIDSASPIRVRAAVRFKRNANSMAHRVSRESRPLYLGCAPPARGPRVYSTEPGCVATLDGLRGWECPLLLL